MRFMFFRQGNDWIPVPLCERNMLPGFAAVNSKCTCASDTQCRPCLPAAQVTLPCQRLNPRWQLQEVIEPGNRPWMLSVVLVTDNDVCLRLCMDYRGVNVVTWKDLYLVLCINDTLDCVAGSLWISSLDFQRGWNWCPRPNFFHHFGS